MAQDYDGWELILVDDGSSDKSTQIAKHYALLYPNKIYYKHHPGHCNEGLGTSRNLGIENAKGEYIAFIDADDVWLPEKLGFQLDIFRRTGVTVVLEASLYWNSWAGSSKADAIVSVGADEGIYRPPQLMFALYPLGEGAAPCSSGIMAHRSVFSPYMFDESFRGIYQMYKDQTFLCKVYLKEVIYVSASWHNKYRQRESSIISTVKGSGKYHNVRSYYLQWLHAYLKSQRLSSRRIRALVRKARMPYLEPVKYKLLVTLPRLVREFTHKMSLKLASMNFSRTQRA